jgi:2-dehydro-3-deoxyphosphogluconate aldolase/(4S)-4-hydroxy-2-oxoglutarate aldolase
MQEMHPIIEQILKHPVVPLFYHDDPDVCKKIIEACYKGGVRVFEMAKRGKNMFANFEPLKHFQQKEFPGCLLGAGTIMHEDDANKIVDAGADFIISPCFSTTVFDACYQLKKPYIPGAMTVKEIADALEAGCEMIKVFPGEVLGPAFVKAVKSVMPHVHLMATGGVNSGNLKDWFKAGVSAVGIGSQVFKAGYIERGDYNGIVKEFEEMIAKV